MIYLKLFLIFLKISAVSFGGGYGMIALLRDDCLAQGWLTEEQFLNFIAVAESTPGPIIVNMATFVGASQAGIGGALLATLGVILPAFVLILLLAIALKRLMQFAGVNATLDTIKPAVVGLIVATALIMFVEILFGVKTVDDSFALDWKSLVIFGVVGALALGYRLIKKKTFPPILLILLSGGLGIIFFGVL